MRPWMLAAAFGLGLAPGAWLYWRSLPVPSVVSAPVPVVAAPVISQPNVPQASVDKKGATAPPRSAGAVPSVFEAAEMSRLLAERSHQLEVAQSTQADLTRQLRELESKFEAVTQEEAKTKAQLASFREQIAQIEKDGEALRSAARARESAWKEMEANAAQLRRRAGEDAQRNAKRKQAGVELEELGRRRESYLNSILGRYREATDLFRAMSLRLDNPRDAGSPLSNDLSRIQQAIQLADEDLRQLRALSAQAARWQKELN